ncbi:MAG: SRPBCC domain-containing protein [Myxococcales bacterium]|nr:SRPBCC domain-containing protein [Myxococcales bacterium]MCB9737156.1 SRPBCC domain-containing protein [Deltaproteobacteria bacterium]
MTSQNTDPTRNVRVFRVYIKATAQAIWDAITDPEQNASYGYHAAIFMDLEPGGAYRAQANEDMLRFGMPETIIDGEVVEADPPRRLVHTYRFLFNEGTAAEGFSTLTWLIEPESDKLCRAPGRGLGDLQRRVTPCSSSARAPRRTRPAHRSSGRRICRGSANSRAPGVP